MIKIGILTCIHSNEVCTGAGCFKAFRHRTDFFYGYGEDAELAAFMSCNGCKEEREQEPDEDAGILEKLERLKAEGVEIIHVGACRFKDDKSECERLMKICNLIEKQGIQIRKGTHKEAKQHLSM